MFFHDFSFSNLKLFTILQIFFFSPNEDINPHSLSRNFITTALNMSFSFLIFGCLPSFHITLPYAMHPTIT